MALYKIDPLLFLTRECYTLDQHGGAIELFPGEKYLEFLVDAWQREPLIILMKSRQMLCTWLFSLLYLWWAMFTQGKLVFFQSKKLEDAVGDENAATGPLGRAKFTYNRMPDAIKNRFPCRITETKMVFPRSHSTIWAIPQGADVIRQHTVAGIFSDEVAFQNEFEGAYTALMPAIQGGGRATFVSTAELGFAWDLFIDRVE